MPEINKYINELEEVLKTVRSFEKEIEQVVQKIIEVFDSGGKLLLCGNGGSAAEAQHIATEYVSSLKHDVKRKSLPAMALASDITFITAASNDFGYSGIFERQVEGYGQKGDILIALTTSGNSENVLLAADKAKEKGLFIIGITGKTGGKLAGKCDVCFKIPSSNTQRIQEVSLLIQHIIVEEIELRMFGN